MAALTYDELLELAGRLEGRTLGSLRPSDYADVTRNAFYYVGLLLHAEDRE